MFYVIDCRLCFIFATHLNFGVFHGESLDLFQTKRFPSGNVKGSVDTGGATANPCDVEIGINLVKEDIEGPLLVQNKSHSISQGDKEL